MYTAVETNNSSIIHNNMYDMLFSYWRAFGRNSCITVYLFIMYVLWHVLWSHVSHMTCFVCSRENNVFWTETNELHEKAKECNGMGSQLIWSINFYSASHDNWCTATHWNRIMTAQCEGMGEVGSARYEPALLPPCPSRRVLCYSNCQRSTQSHQQSKG